MTMQLKFKKLRPDAKIPTRATPGSSGLDLCAWFPEPLPEYYYKRGHGFVDGERKLVMTGLSVEILPGFEGQVRSRSGLALNHGLIVLNSPGTIDSDFRGELGVILFAHQRYFVNHGDRIAQLVISPVAMCEPVDVDELDETERGSGGFGSTGR